MNTAQNHYHLAQINVGQLLAPQDDPRLAEFVDNLDRINALAERSPGFIWRLQDDSGNALSYQAFDDPELLSNLSVWADVQSLRSFVYHTQHKAFVMRRKEWFHLLGKPYLALWWIPAGHIPTLQEGVERLKLLREAGATPKAFNFSKIFSPEEEMS
ncbi:DUF3291 domain-containing protein [Exilibacterium tricleocarpae]|uniref:DUF3291 domain-containing protein n=1 Tax=Exilibacterium tricleocarpae TaxID=2591008 RepID=A0A545ST78_9GAMM|nr:DUF3291 domain-containing protein [Exilibacterium tricleocarpae]TQV68162.1 DUF3291 domain-containing protein [Exilibacterium tricleocarpae]